MTVAKTRAQARFGSLLVLAALLATLLPWSVLVPTVAAKQVAIHVDDDATPGGNGTASLPLQKPAGGGRGRARLSRSRDQGRAR